MYLSDNEIRALLPELALHSPHDEHPFDEGLQIQPCSIDLRLSDVFWKASRRRRLWHRAMPWRAPTIDLRHSRMHELAPLRDWKQIRLRTGSTLTIKPGQVLMARIYERFQVPPSYAGKVEGRSSYARLGLFVHCSGDFINPGWSGFMPLQLFNAGAYPIRITPFISVCQLKLVRLSSLPSRTYGDNELQSKYVNDDGGPSFWWRDRMIEGLQRRLGEIDVTEGIQREILDRVRFESPGILERFEQFVRSQRIQSVENVEELLDRFAAREDRLRRVDQLSVASVPILLPVAFGSLFVHHMTALHILAWVLAGASLLIGMRAFLRRDMGYLGRASIPDDATTTHRPDRTA